MNNALQQQQPGYELRFESLCREGHAYAFACDHDGRVDMDRMSERVRNSYLFARTVIGREVTMPRVHLAC
jgi:hypothetical protein